MASLTIPVPDHLVIDSHRRLTEVFKKQGVPVERCGILAKIAIAELFSPEIAAIVPEVAKVGEIKANPNPALVAVATSGTFIFEVFVAPQYAGQEPHCFGKVEASTFDSALTVLAQRNSQFRRLFNPDNRTFKGRKIFPSAKDAIESVARKAV